MAEMHTRAARHRGNTRSTWLQSPSELSCQDNCPLSAIRGYPPKRRRFRPRSESPKATNETAAKRPRGVSRCRHVNFPIVLFKFTNQAIIRRCRHEQRLIVGRRNTSERVGKFKFVLTHE